MILYYKWTLCINERLINLVKNGRHAQQLAPTRTMKTHRVTFGKVRMTKSVHTIFCENDPVDDVAAKMEQESVEFISSGR